MKVNCTVFSDGIVYSPAVNYCVTSRLQDPEFLHCVRTILSHSFLTDCPRVWQHHPDSQCISEVLLNPTSAELSLPKKREKNKKQNS